jgi:uncharacterized protein YdaU (DUF1376 family)
MGKPPWFKFYPSDFYMGTLDFSNAQVGAYIRLLCRQWDKGAVPESAFLATTNGLSDEEIEAVQGKFLREDGPHGVVYRNRRLIETHEKLDAFIQKQSENGKLGADARWQDFANGQK